MDMNTETVMAIVSTVLLGVSESLPFVTSVKSNGVMQAIGIFCSTCAKKWNAADQVLTQRVICREIAVQTDVDTHQVVTINE